MARGDLRKLCWLAARLVWRTWPNQVVCALVPGWSVETSVMITWTRDGSRVVYQGTVREIVRTVAAEARQRRGALAA